jgi:hypothetical protein
MTVSNPNSSSKRFCEVFQMTAKERNKRAQTGSALGTFSYRQQHPKYPTLVFNFYRKRADGTHSEAWILKTEMELRHQQRVTSNLARARARGVPERKPAAPKSERLKKARISQERTRQKKRKQDAKMTAEQDLQRWQVLAQMLGKSVEEIRQ